MDHRDYLLARLLAVPVLPVSVVVVVVAVVLLLLRLLLLLLQIPLRKIPREGGLLQAMEEGQSARLNHRGTVLARLAGSAV